MENYYLRIVWVWIIMHATLKVRLRYALLSSFKRHGTSVCYVLDPESRGQSRISERVHDAGLTGICKCVVSPHVTSLSCCGGLLFILMPQQWHHQQQQQQGHLTLILYRYLDRFIEALSQIFKYTASWKDEMSGKGKERFMNIRNCQGISKKAMK